MTEYEYVDADGDIFEAHIHETGRGERVLRLTCATSYPGPRDVTVHVALHNAPDLIEALQAIHDEAASKPEQVDALTRAYYRLGEASAKIEKLENALKQISDLQIGNQTLEDDALDAFLIADITLKELGA